MRDRAFLPIYLSLAICAAVLLGTAHCASSPTQPGQQIAQYATPVVQATNVLARTAAGLADSHVLTVPEGAQIVIAADRIDQLGTALAPLLRAYDAAAVADRPQKVAAIIQVIERMRAVLAAAHLPPGRAQGVADALAAVSRALVAVEAIWGLQ